MSRTEQEKKWSAELDLWVAFSQWLKAHGVQPSAKYDGWLIEVMDRVLSEGVNSGTK